MGTLYIDTGGSATNSGSRDSNTAALSGTGASNVGTTVNLPAGTDLSSVQTSGAAQDTIYLNDATNPNRKIFWITAKDDTLDTVTVDVEPTGLVSSSWAIGGRMVLTPANYEAGVRAGDRIILNNSPASGSTDLITSRVAGNSTSGFITYVGKTGVRPVLTITNTAQCLELGAFAQLMFENLELAQQGASGNCVTLAVNGQSLLFYNLKISDAGGSGVDASANVLRVIGCEISGTGGDGFNFSTGGSWVCGTYIHDLTGDGIDLSYANQSMTLLNDIVDTTGGRGLYWSGAPSNTGQTLLIQGCTVYGCGNSGLEITDQDAQVILMNTILSENGNAAGEYNVEWVAGDAEKVSFHAWNVFYHSGGGGGANLSNLTVNAQVASSEFTTDPLFTDAAGGNFAISSTSPAKATGFPGQFLGGSLGYLDIGAVQRQEPAGGGSQRVIGG